MNCKHRAAWTNEECDRCKIERLTAELAAATSEHRHCRDCCCARVWRALGLDGRADVVGDIGGYVLRAVAERDFLQAAIDNSGMIAVRTPKPMLGAKPCGPDDHLYVARAGTPIGAAYCIKCGAKEPQGEPDAK